MAGWLGRRHDALDHHAVGHSAIRAVELGVDRSEDVTLFGRQAVASKRTRGPPSPHRLNVACRRGLICSTQQGRPRVWLQGKGGGLKPGEAAVLLPPKEGETDASPVAYRTPLRQALMTRTTAT